VYHTPTVLLLYSYCTVIVPVLVLKLYSYCTHTVLLLYSYCTHTVLLLYWNRTCTRTPTVLVLKLHSYCAHTVLILYYSHCTHSQVQMTCTDGQVRACKSMQEHTQHACVLHSYCTPTVLTSCTRTVLTSCTPILYSHPMHVYCTHILYSYTVLLWTVRSSTALSAPPAWWTRLAFKRALSASGIRLSAPAPTIAASGVATHHNAWEGGRVRRERES
jgi:hypothetical protein